MPRRGFAPPRNDTLPSFPLGEGAPVGTLGRMRGTPKGWKRLRGNGYSLPPGRGKVVPKGPDEGGYRWVQWPSNGRMGTSAPTQGHDGFCRGRCPQRPVDNGCTPVVPLIRHGLRPCHLLPCGAKAITALSGVLKCRWRSPHPSRLRRATFPLPGGSHIHTEIFKPDSTFRTEKCPVIPLPVPSYTVGTEGHAG